jgi:peptide/nickel transport system ATP-binding protein
MITHDLGVVAELSDRILVMYAGRSIEQGTVEELFHSPQHPYTWGLLGSMPRLDRERTERLIPVRGTPPSLINLPSGCSFHPRCDYAELNGGRSTTETPELEYIGEGRHRVACHLTAEQRQEIWETQIKPNL